LVCKHGDINIRVSSLTLTEVLLVFGVFYDFYNVSGTNSGVRSTAPPTTDELVLRKYMQSACVAFARDPAKGLFNFGWPMYNADSESNATTQVELGGVFQPDNWDESSGRVIFALYKQCFLSFM